MLAPLPVPCFLWSRRQCGFAVLDVCDEKDRVLWAHGWRKAYQLIRTPTSWLPSSEAAEWTAVGMNVEC